MQQSLRHFQQLIALNVAVFVAFHVLGNGRDDWIRDHFYVSAEALFQGRVWTLMTSSISHIDTTHLLFNMLGIWIFGQLVEERMGPSGLWALVIGGALSSGLGHVLYDFQSPGTRSALGASGVVLALAAAAAWLEPRRKILLFFFLPLPMYLVMPLFVAIDVLGLMGGGSPVAHAAHLGGVAWGVVWIGVWRRRNRPPESGPDSR